jgi:hypothetical protein
VTRKRPYQLLCPIARALDVVGDRWALLILRDLHAGPARFAQLTTAETIAPVALIAPIAAPAEVSARLERIESSLEQAAQRQSGLESVFDKEIESLRTAATIPSRQSLVNVRVDYPPLPVERKKEKRHSGKKHCVF